MVGTTYSACILLFLQCLLICLSTFFTQGSLPRQGVMQTLALVNVVTQACNSQTKAGTPSSL